MNQFELEETYYIARELRGLSEALFVAVSSPDSAIVHVDDAMRVLSNLADKLVDELESVMNMEGKDDTRDN